MHKGNGHVITATGDLTVNKHVWRVILELSQQIAHPLRKHHLSAGGIQLRVKNHSLFVTEFQARCPYPKQSALEIARLAYKLFCKRYDWRQSVRAISVRAISLQPEGQAVQFDLFEDNSASFRLEQIDRTVDEIRSRFGDHALRNAVLLQDLRMPESKPAVLPPAFGIK